MPHPLNPHPNVVWLPPSSSLLQLLCCNPPPPPPLHSVLLLQQPGTYLLVQSVRPTPTRDKGMQGWKFPVHSFGGRMGKILVFQMNEVRPYDPYGLYSFCNAGDPYGLHSAMLGTLMVSILQCWGPPTPEVDCVEPSELIGVRKFSSHCSCSQCCG